MLRQPQRFIIPLSVFCFMFSAIACYPDIPIEFYIHSDWEQDEKRAILTAADEWEKATCLDLFEFQGIRRDDGFVNWREQLQDKKRVVYPEDGLWIDGEEGNDSGIAFAKQDIVVLRRFVVNCANAKQLNMECDRGFYLLSLKKVVTHEFGHWLLLGHQDTGEPTIMSECFDNPYAAWTLQKSEVDIVCETYGCPAKCEGRPALTRPP